MAERRLRSVDGRFVASVREVVSHEQALLVRLAAKIDLAGVDDCWLWTGARNDSGYGTIFLDGRYAKAHRVVYAIEHGPVPEGLDLDHTCHNADPSCVGGRACIHRRCVNPSHLEPVSHRINLARGRERMLI